MLWSIDNCPNKVSTDQYHLTVSWAQNRPIKVKYCFEVIRWQVTSFQMIASPSSIFLKCIGNKFCLLTALWKVWCQTQTSDAQIQQVVTGSGGSSFWLFSTCPRVGHALRPIFMLWLVKICQVSSNGKFIQHLETSLPIAEAYRVLCCHLAMFF